MTRLATHQKALVSAGVLRGFAVPSPTLPTDCIMHPIPPLNFTDSRELFLRLDKGTSLTFSGVQGSASGCTTTLTISCACSWGIDQMYKPYPMHH